MDSLNDLAKRLMALDDRLTDCMRCGMCQAVCPMFGASGMEADVARGKLALIGNMAHELLTDAEALADKLGRCLLCGSCQAACPPGVKIMEIFREAREIVHDYLGLHPVKKLVFRFLLANPRLFNLSMSIGAPVQHLLFKKSNDAQGTVCAPMLDFMLGDRHIRSLASETLHGKYGTIDEQASAGQIKVVFYPGCLGDKMYTEMGEACLKVLRYHNVAIFMASNFACCGIPALSSGDAKGMLKQLACNLKILEKKNFDYLVTPCGSCTSTIKELWPEYAERLDHKAQVLTESIAQKTMDINEFLVKVLKVEAKAPAENATPITYHDSCHLKKSLGVSAEPRTVLQSNPNYKLVEMSEADRCCGCGGSFNLFHYDYSRQIGQRKRDNVVASGAKVVSAGCPACMMQLEDVLSHNNDPVKVKHTVEIYAETLQ
ncbi:MAG: (Fe-S)-binding protein [Desulfovibrionaceae bacterium]|nr:(Fe-S)-binding protein [Desulfovibrionaceae bacterium]